MSATRRKSGKEFKAKVVLESLKERETLESLAKKYELLTHSNFSVESPSVTKFRRSILFREARIQRKTDRCRQTLFPNRPVERRERLLKKKLQ